MAQRGERTLLAAVQRRPGCDVHYGWRPSRDGRWVVFLHGAGADHTMFDAQLGAVPEGMGIIAPDTRGHGASVPLSGGFSYREALADTIAILTGRGVTRAVLVGQSMGGNLAQTLARERSDLVEGLVLIDCTDNAMTLTTGEKATLRLAQPLLRAYPWRATIRASAAACGSEPHTQAYMRASLERMGQAAMVDILGYWRVAFRSDPSYRLPCPTLLVLGEKDRTGNIARAMRAWPARDPRVQLHVVPGAAHNANMDRPEAVNALLGAFLRESVGVGPASAHAAAPDVVAASFGSVGPPASADPVPSPAARVSGSALGPVPAASRIPRRAVTEALIPGAALVVGIAAAGRLITGPLRGLPAEDELNHALVRRRTPALNRATWLLSTYSDTAPTIAAAVGYGLLASRSGGWREGAAPLAAITLETAVFTSAAAMVGRPRPDVPWLDRPAPTSSFPSGHTAATTALHLTCARLLERRGAPRAVVASARYAVPPLVAFSRLYRGMHHPSDVVVGLGLGVWAARAVGRTLGG